MKTYKETAYCHKCKAVLVIDKSSDEWKATELANEEFERIFSEL